MIDYKSAVVYILQLSEYAFNLLFADVGSQLHIKLRLEKA